MSGSKNLSSNVSCNEAVRTCLSWHPTPCFRASIEALGRLALSRHDIPRLCCAAIVRYPITLHPPQSIFLPPRSFSHPPTSTMGLPQTQVWSREQVATRILAGETLFVLHGNLVRVPPSWLTLHPGGNLSILHYVGRDATDEVEAFHSPETLQRMKSYVVGQVEIGEDGWAPFVPPYSNGWVRRKGVDGRMEWYNEARAVKGKTEAEAAILLVSRDAAAPAEPAPTMADLEPAPNSLSMKNEKLHAEAYRELHQRVKDAGLYQCRYVTGYGPEVVRYSLLAITAAVCYSKGWLIPSAISLGLFWQQLTFTAHDLGHVSVTHDWTLDRLISIFVADFLGGLSISWWVNVSTVLLTPYSTFSS